MQTTIDPTYQLISPTPDVINNDVGVEEFIRDSMDHTHHWMGSNRMGTNPSNGVVDRRGKVFGASHLYVVDDSIAPVQNDGNTNAPAYAIAATIAENIINGEQ